MGPIGLPEDRVPSGARGEFIFNSRARAFVRTDRITMTARVGGDTFRLVGLCAALQRSMLEGDEDE